MREFLFLDGKPLEQKLPLRSLFYGEGLFETFRWKDSPPVFLRKHLKRMKKDSELLSIPFPGEEKIKNAVREAVDKSGVKDAYVKLCLLSAGPIKFHERGDEGQVLVVVRGYEPPKEYVRVHVTPFKRASSSPLLRVKSLNYLENVLARREAERMGYDEALLLNERGEVTEGSSTNIFWVKRNVLYTPALECGLLPGITREALISLAPELDLEVKEGRFNLDEVLTSQGAFFTNSLIGITAITEIDKVRIRVNNELFEGLRCSLYRKLGWIS
jgi:4-amino-4-deoxychorismate lyase